MATLLSGGFSEPSWFELGFLSLQLTDRPPVDYVRDLTTGRIFARWVDAQGRRWAVDVAALPVWPAGWPPHPFVDPPPAAAEAKPGSDGPAREGLGVLAGDLAESAGNVLAWGATAAGKVAGGVGNVLGRVVGGAAAGATPAILSSPYAVLGIVVALGAAVWYVRRS